MNRKLTIFPVLLCLHLVLRLGHSFVVIWGTCITVRKESSGADSLSGGRSSVHSDLFVNDASLANDPGINFPPVFASEFAHLDSLPTLASVPLRASDSFRFVDEDHSRFFSSQSLAHETEAFGHSLKAPHANPLLSKEYRSTDKNWRFVAEASSLAARLAVFSTALLDLLNRADALGVSEEDKILIRAVLVEISVLSFSQAARVQLHATSRRRYLALESLSLPKGFNGYAVDQIPRVGRYIFGGKFLEAVDSDLNMNKRAREVADRFRPQRPDSFRRFRGGRSSLFPSRGRFRGQRSRAGGQARFSVSRYRGGSRARFSGSTPPPPPL